MKSNHLWLLTSLLLALGSMSGFAAETAKPTCGLTIITHGFQSPAPIGNGAFPGWVREMAQAITNRVGAAIPIYRIRYDKATDTVLLQDGPASIDITQAGGAIVVLDWVGVANETQDYPAQNVASRFFDYLFGQRHNGHYLAELPIHLIGHSRGCSLNSRLSYSLAENGILVEQVTTLDPHPVRPWHIPSGTDWVPETFINVVFADNYYQPDDAPEGMVIPGAFNQNLTSVLTGVGNAEHTHVHTYYHGTVDLSAASVDTDSIVAAWYQGTRSRDETGFNFGRYTNSYLSRPTSGVNQFISGGTGTGSRVLVDTAFQFWPNAGFDQRISIPNRVTVGSTISIPYYFSDRSSQQTITFSLDADTNPFNGVQADIGSATQNSRPAGSIGSSSLSWTPTAADVGTHYIRVITTNTKTDLVRTRFDYFLLPIIVEAGATPRPTISDVSPRTLNAQPVGQTQLITITGTGFTSSSRLTFNDGVNSPYTDRVPASWTATQLTYNIAVGPAARTWTAKVVNGVAESLPYTFFVVSGAAELTALSIQGPATVTENGNGQFSATALFNNGSQQPSVTPVIWGVTGSGASINPSSGYLTAGSVSANSPVTVTASYSTGGITKSTSANMTIVDVGSGGGTQTQELIVNPQFSSAPLGWTATGNFYYDNRFTSAYSLGGYAYLSNPDGTKGNGLTGQLDQTIQIPASATRVILSYWYRITTDETDGNPRDFMFLRLIDSTGTTLVDSLSNLAASAAYQRLEFDITAFKGRTATVSFYCPATSVSNPTTFRVDDVSVLATVPPPVTLSSLAINGPSSVAEGTFGTYYTATAIYSDGSTNLVTPTWQLNTSFGTLLSNGELRTDYVIADVATSITATFGGQTANKLVTIVDVAPTFSYVAISGPTAINEGSSGQFTATAIFSDGSSQSAPAAWNVSGTGASIGPSSGLLSAGEVSADAVVTVSASATVGGVTRSGSQPVTIVNSTASPTLTSLSIAGPDSLNKNSTAQYSATATFSDGSIQTANPTWSEDSTATSISSFGLLSAGEVAGDTVMTVTASYTAGGLTRIASKIVTVVNGVPTPQTGTLQFSSAAFSGNEGSGTTAVSVVRTGGSAGAVGVSFTTANGTAIAGADYSAASGTLSWADGDATTKTFSVTIIEDDLVEGNETVMLTLSSPTGGAALGTLALAALTIIENDLGGSGALPVTIASGLNVPGGMALDGNDVYFSDNTASDGIIKRVSKDGGAMTTVVSGAVLNDAGAARGVARFLITDGNIFGEYGGYESHAVFRALASGGTRTTLTSENGGSFIGVSGGNIYYGSGFSNLRSMSTNGGSPNQLLSGYWVRGSAIDGTNIYFIEYNSRNVLRYNMASSTLTPLITNNATEGGIFIDADRVFFNIDGSIKMVAKSGGVVTTLVSSTTAAGHVSDGISLFFTENGAIKSLPLSGGAPAFILTEPAGGVGLAVDETFLYYSDRSGGPGAGRIIKLPKTGLQPPVITAGLTNQTASVGANVLLSVAAYGLTPLTYQWFKDATILTGVTTSNLALANVQLTNAGSYTVVASDSRGVISSSIAVLAVNPAQGSKLVAWGANNAGQRNVPDSLLRVVAVTGGSAHTLALQNDGNLLAWGQNTYEESTVPVAAQSEVTAIAAGVDHSLALKRDGTLVAWGRNNRGQTTVPAAAQTGVIAVAAGEAHSLVLKSDGSAFAWGHNFYSQGSVPTAAQSGVVAIAARGAHNLALKTNGTVVAWGYNGAGESTVPAGLSGVVAVAAGENHSVALKADGTVVAWGDDQFGQGSVPSGLSGVVAIAAGGYYNLALRMDGTAIAWGDDREGQAAVPAVIQGKILQLAAGNHHSLALVDPLQLAPPSITSQPTSLILPSGSNATFAVVASGATPLLYQWKKNSTVLPGETNAQLQLMNLRRVDSAQYSVAISNTFGGVLSTNAALRVIVRQSFVNAPVRLGDSGFRLLFGDHDGGLLTSNDATSIVVEFSPDLKNWFTLTNAFTISNGQAQVDDTGSANLPRRYYRVIER